MSLNKKLLEELASSTKQDTADFESLHDRDVEQIQNYLYLLKEIQSNLLTQGIHI